MWWKGLVILCFGCNQLTSGQSAYFCPSDPNSYGRVCTQYKDKCETNQDCTVPGHGCCLVAGCGKECFNLARPRVCPKPPPLDPDFCMRANIAVGCISDEQCVGEDKICCPAGKCHIKECVYPPRYGSPNPGVCPTPVLYRPEQCTKTPMFTDCKRDTDCQGGKKCCETPCGVLQCQDPLINRPECPLILCTKYQDLCKSDKDCSYDEVCCYSQNCGRSCKKRKNTGLVAKPGRCPKNLNPDVACAAVVNPYDCRGDSSCPGNLKCCVQGCFRLCESPVSKYGKSREKRQKSQITKPGQCPPEERFDCVGPLPVNPCSGDGMCPGNQKCCSDGCSKICQDPSPKPGRCPTNINPHALCALVIYPDDCKGDQSCNGKLKCCLQGCRTECQAPVARKKRQSLPKPGRCKKKVKPRSDCGVAIPNHACFGDYECPGKQKCCSNGCYGVCEDPKSE